MILYANGCSHTAAAEAVNSAAFAQDDPRYQHLKRQPHPDNLDVSWCKVLADSLDASLICDAESAASNHRIIRTTRQWMQQNQALLPRVVMVIQWTTWEREEWWHDDQWYQVNASGQDHVPPVLQDRYRQFIADVDWTKSSYQVHDQVWQLHLELEDQGVRHVFFNGNSAFDRVKCQRSWNDSYISPYEIQGTFDQILRKHRFLPVKSNSYHFGADAHCFWAGYLLQYMHDHKLVEPTCAIS